MFLPNKECPLRPGPLTNCLRAHRRAEACLPLSPGAGGLVEAGGACLLPFTAEDPVPGGPKGIHVCSRHLCRFTFQHPSGQIPKASGSEMRLRWVQVQPLSEELGAPV